MNGSASRIPVVLDRDLDRCDPDRRWDRRLALFRSAEQGPLGIGNRPLGHHRVDCGSCDPALACWSMILNVTVATFASRRPRHTTHGGPSWTRRAPLRHQATTISVAACRASRWLAARVPHRSSDVRANYCLPVISAISRRRFRDRAAPATRPFSAQPRPTPRGAPRRNATGAMCLIRCRRRRYRARNHCRRTLRVHALTHSAIRTEWVSDQLTVRLTIWLAVPRM